MLRSKIDSNRKNRILRRIKLVSAAERGRKAGKAYPMLIFLFLLLFLFSCSASKETPSDQKKISLTRISREHNTSSLPEKQIDISNVNIPSSTGSNLTEDQAKAILSIHNATRSEVGVAPLSWSPEIAAYAQNWADYLAQNGCSLQHRPRSGKWKQIYGENAFIGTRNYYRAESSAQSWAKEKIYYHGGVLNNSNWNKSGHYTQMVWKNSARIGCGQSECKDMLIVICNYDPPGNFMGEKPY